MSEDQKQFKMRFDPNTIRHLGIKMYSQIPGALAELIANAYDADATKVSVNLDDREMKIVVEDNGMGMTAEEINEKFLVIGRNRREGVAENITPSRRIPSGKKGLGKLALFGIGNKIKVETKSAGKEAIAFVMDWQRIQSHKQPEYNPEPVDAGEIKGEHGTVVTISELRRKSPFDQKVLANRIARLFNYRVREMGIFVSVNDNPSTQVTPDMFFDGLKKIEADKDSFKSFVYEGKERKITGRIVTNETPLPADVQGVALYANGRMVNRPEFFGDSISGFFYSYATGYLVVDFVDEEHGDHDLISTNRQSINWEDPRMEELRRHLRGIILEMAEDWRKKRREVSKEKAKKAISQNVAFGDLRPRIQRGVMNILNKNLQLDTKSFINDFTDEIPPKQSGKKIMISHTGADKRFANVIYQGLLVRGVAPEHILYTNSDNVLSRLPVDVEDIHEYIREFFIQDFYPNPYVIFIASKNMEESWHAVIEAGAAWVNGTARRLATVNGYQPKPPLNLGNQLYIAFTEEGEYVDEKEANRILDSVVKKLAKMPAD